MDKYVGIDVHSTSCTAVIVNKQGRKLGCHVLATSGEALVGLVKKQRGTLHVCIEEGTQAGWVWELISPHVSECVVAAMSEKRRGPKDDAQDAWYWAEQLRLGAVKRRVYKETKSYAQLRELVKAHRAVMRDTVRMQSRIKALYRSRGVRVSDENVYAARGRETWLGQLPSNSRLAAELLYAAYDGLESQRKAAHKAVVVESHRHGISRMLETCPGLGEIRVAQLQAVVVSPHRFRTRQQFWAYCGLGIVMRSSSDWAQDAKGRWMKVPVKQTRGLNRNHNHMLKHVCKGAATTAIGQPSGPMREAYDRLLAQGVKPNLAKLTIARKIAASALAMWKQKEVYQPDKSKPKR